MTNEDTTQLGDAFTIEDGRDDIPVFIHGDLDDLPLTLQAFRIYCHIARRAGRTGEAWDSYKQLGELLQPTYPKSQPETLKRKAIEAVGELLSLGLIARATNTRADGGTGRNHYRLTPRSEWKLPGKGGGGASAPGRVHLHREGASAYAKEVTPLEVTPSLEVTPTTHTGGAGGGAGGAGVVVPPSAVGGNSNCPQTAGGCSAELDTEPERDPVTEPQQLQDGDAADEPEPEDLPRAVADAWVGLFGELTDKQRAMLRKACRSDTAGVTLEAIRELARRRDASGEPTRYAGGAFKAALRHVNSEILSGRRRVEPQTGEDRRAMYCPPGYEHIINRGLSS